MGRIGGFLGGTVLTGSLAYLTFRHLKINTRTHSASLRTSRQIADSILLPKHIPKKPEPKLERPSFVETLKDTWNWEVEKIVRRMQKWDMRTVREEVEETVGNVVEKLKRQF
ncbi:hypothetical protein L873DRAFT_1795363 [Choiromyces venosus 120613-1]|uniref:MICOS complex subunit MIC12 n=1 Tax=Choiromyces venosus 120613-1 TaxID=1336337 RepID=A0A3N4IXL1_9PEZI|nr:hypothetical protein L873DRAFT_1795363 [Choiromyces venosus 120613-1]